MWRTVRIRQREYEFVRDLAKEEKKSMCEVVSEIVAERKENNIKGGETGLEAKAALTILIAELDSILRDTRTPAERKVEKIEALLYTWIMGNKLPVWEVRNWKGLVMMEVKDNEKERL